MPGGLAYHVTTQMVYFQADGAIMSYDGQSLRSTGYIMKRLEEEYSSAAVTTNEEYLLFFTDGIMNSFPMYAETQTVLSIAGSFDNETFIESYCALNPTIAITYTQDDPFINALKEQLKGNLKTMETKDMKIMISERNGDNDQRDQNEAVEEMIDAGCDIMCINLVDRTEPSTIIKMARQNNIPVIFFNREPVKEDLKQWDKLYYVGCNAEQSGEMQGQIAAKYIKKNKKVDKNYDGRIQYVLLEGEAGHQDAISRTDCSVKTIIGKGIKLEKIKLSVCRLE